MRNGTRRFGGQASGDKGTVNAVHPYAANRRTRPNALICKAISTRPHARGPHAAARHTNTCHVTRVTMKRGARGGRRFAGRTAAAPCPDAYAELYRFTAAQTKGAADRSATPRATSDSVSPTAPGPGRCETTGACSRRRGEATHPPQAAASSPAPGPCSPPPDGESGQTGAGRAPSRSH